MRLDSERIYLKELSVEELDGNYVNWLNDPEVCRFNSHGETEYTKDAAIDFVQSLAGDSTREVWAVYLKQPHVHIGNIALQNIDLGNKNAEIAYLFGEKEYWGSGYAKEASELLIHRGFEGLGLHRIYFGTHVGNLRMQRLGEKLGFVQEGVLRDAQFKFGAFNDVVVFARLSPWSAR